MNTPKFKIGDRVRHPQFYGVGVVIQGHADNRYTLDTTGGWVSKVPGDQLVLDVPETHKFKIGDRVKWVHFGKPSFGFIRARLSECWWKVEYTAGCMENCHESGLSLDVPEPKQFATKLEAELGAEIIKLHYDAAHLNTRLTEEIGGRHRERIAKEAVQKELAEVRPALVRERAILADIYNAMLKPRI